MPRKQELKTSKSKLQWAARLGPALVLGLAVFVLLMMYRAEKRRVADLRSELNSSVSKVIELEETKRSLELANKSLDKVAQAAAAAPSRVNKMSEPKPQSVKKDAPVPFAGILVSKAWAADATACLEKRVEKNHIMSLLRQDADRYKTERDRAVYGKKVWRNLALGAGVALVVVAVVK